MRKTWAVARREFQAFVATKTFILGTLFGPLILLFIVALPVLFSSDEDVLREIVVVEDPEAPLGREVAELLGSPSGGRRFRVRLVTAPPGRTDSVRTALARQVAADSLDGYVLLPHDLRTDEPIRYEGRGVADFATTAQIRSAVQRAVQERRLREAGIDPEALAAALRPVPFEARGVARGEEARDSPESAFWVVYFGSFATYMVVLLYGIAILRGVQDEKEQRVVEILLSSLRPRQLMEGKVLGIGVAGLLQVAVWIAFGALVSAYGPDVARSAFGAELELPHLAPSMSAVYLFFFLGGYFVYASLYAALGAVATSTQEANQLQYPALVPLMIAFFMSLSAVDNPDGTLTVAGSIVPLTSPLMMPARAVLAPVPWTHMALSVALLVASCFALLWLAGAIFRVTILATGSRPTARQIWRWMRAS